MSEIPLSCAARSPHHPYGGVLTDLVVRNEELAACAADAAVDPADAARAVPHRGDDCRNSYEPSLAAEVTRTEARTRQTHDIVELFRGRVTLGHRERFRRPRGHHHGRLARPRARGGGA